MRAVFLRNHQRWVRAGVIGVVLVVAVGAWTQRASLAAWFRERPFRTALPAPQPADVFSPRGPAAPSTGETVSPPPAGLKSLRRGAPAPAPWSARDINLAVPFAPQAPFANWDQPYQDACEEATIVMIERYFRSAPLSLQEMDAELLRMVRFQDERYGFYRDSNAAETARLAEAYYPHLSARVVYDVTADAIRAAVSSGNPVLVLVDGRRLGNPFYKPPGPSRHTLVIKGVKGSSFITNDPGTRRGADFVYPSERVMGSLVDYDGGTPGTGKRSMILLTPRGS